METNPNQRKSISFDKRATLRKEVRVAYEKRNRETLLTPNNKENTFYQSLQDDIKKIADIVISTATLNEFFNKDSKDSYRIETINALEKYVQSASNKPLLHDNIKNDLRENIQNRMLKYYREKINLMLDNFDDLDLELGACSVADIEFLEQLKPLHESLGEIHWDLIKERLAVNTNLVQGLKIITPMERNIVGFFIIYPLTRQCKDLLDSGAIMKSDQFELTHICENFETARAIYISLVYAIFPLSKAILILEIKEQLKNILRKYPNIERIFTRPITDDGLRNAHRNLFQKINVSDIYFTDTSALTLTI